MLLEAGDGVVPTDADLDGDAAESAASGVEPDQAQPATVSNRADHDDRERGAETPCAVHRAIGPPPGSCGRASRPHSRAETARIHSTPDAQGNPVNLRTASVPIHPRFVSKGCPGRTMIFAISRPEPPHCPDATDKSCRRRLRPRPISWLLTARLMRHASSRPPDRMSGGSDDFRELRGSSRVPGAGRWTGPSRSSSSS